MAAATDLEKIAKLADAMEGILDLVRQYGFLVNPRPRLKPGRRPASNGVDEAGQPIKKRRGRPRKVKPATAAVEQPMNDAEPEIDGLE